MDKDSRETRALIELIREATNASKSKGDGQATDEYKKLSERLKGKGKGREILFRYAGEVIDGEPMPIARDTRKEVRRVLKVRNEFHCVTYEVRIRVAPIAVVLTDALILSLLMVVTARRQFTRSAATNKCFDPWSTTVRECPDSETLRAIRLDRQFRQGNEPRHRCGPGNRHHRILVTRGGEGLCYARRWEAFCGRGRFHELRAALGYGGDDVGGF